MKTSPFVLCDSNVTAMNNYYGEANLTRSEEWNRRTVFVPQTLK